MLEAAIAISGVVLLYILWSLIKLQKSIIKKETNNQQADESQKQLTLEVEQNRERFQTLMQTVQGSAQMSNTVIAAVQSLNQTVNEMKQKQIQMDSNSNIKGNMGNVLLKQMLEEIYGENTEGTLWKTEYSIDGVGRPDAVIFYKNVVIPIDSKNLKDDYIKYINDEINLKTLVSTITKSVKDINKYVRPDLNLANYAIMFIPSEQMYYDIIVRNSTNVNIQALRKEAMKNHILICSPNTIYVELLRIMDLVEMNAINSHSKELMDIHRNTHDILNKNVNQLEAWGTRFRNISTEVDTLLNQNKNGLKKFKALGLDNDGEEE